MSNKQAQCAEALDNLSEAIESWGAAINDVQTALSELREVAPSKWAGQGAKLDQYEPALDGHGGAPNSAEMLDIIEALRDELEADE